MIERRLKAIKARLNRKKATSELMQLIQEKIDSPERVQQLILEGAVVNKRDQHGMTLLMHAVINQLSAPLLQVLIHADPSVIDVCKNGRTALSYAISNASPEIVQLFLLSGARMNVGNPKPIVLAVQKLSTEDGNRKAVFDLLYAKLMLMSRQDIHRYGVSEAILVAAEIGHLDVLKALCANIDLREFEWPENRTPLILAARAGHLETVDYLLSAGISAGLEQAFSEAAQNGHAEIVERLADKLNEKGVPSDRSIGFWIESKQHVVEIDALDVVERWNREDMSEFLRPLVTPDQPTLIHVKLSLVSGEYEGYSRNYYFFYGLSEAGEYCFHRLDNDFRRRLLLRENLFDVQDSLPPAVQEEISSVREKSISYNRQTNYGEITCTPRSIKAWCGSQVSSVPAVQVDEWCRNNRLTGTHLICLDLTLNVQDIQLTDTLYLAYFKYIEPAYDEDYGYGTNRVPSEKKIMVTNYAADGALPVYLEKLPNRLFVSQNNYKAFHDRFQNLHFPALRQYAQAFELTALRFAAENGHAESVITILEKRKLHKNCYVHGEKKPLGIAASLKEFQSDHGVLSVAAGAGQLQAIQRLVQYGLPIEYVGRPFSVYSPVEIAASNGHADVVRFLHAQGAVVQHAFGIAASNDHVEVVEALLASEEKGAEQIDINTVDVNGDTALHRAFLQGAYHVVQFLLLQGADGSKINKQGETFKDREPQKNPAQTKASLFFVKGLLELNAIYIDAAIKQGNIPITVREINYAILAAKKILQRDKAYFEKLDGLLVLLINNWTENASKKHHDYEKDVETLRENLKEIGLENLPQAAEKLEAIKNMYLDDTVCCVPLRVLPQPSAPPEEHKEEGTTGCDEVWEDWSWVSTLKQLSAAPHKSRGVEERVDAVSVVVPPESKEDGELEEPPPAYEVAVAANEEVVIPPSLSSTNAYF